MPSRRTVLAAAGSASTVALAGCSVLDTMPDGVRVAVGPPEQTPEADATTIAWTDLTGAERDLLEQAFDGGYRTCDEVPDAANRLADRTEYPQTYLRRDGDLYGLWLVITDVAFAMTTDAPEGDCGLF